MTLGRLGHPGLARFQTRQLLGVAEALLGIPARLLAAQHLFWGTPQGIGHQVLYGGAVSFD